MTSYFAFRPLGLATDRLQWVLLRKSDRRRGGVSFVRSMEDVRPLHAGEGTRRMTSGGFRRTVSYLRPMVEASHGAVTPAGLSDHPRRLANVGQV